ncbi:collagen alpha-1(III) chain-like [Canis lupus dingo]|uniref:collagen alpha-1(III) chain-like n=1 Tax=Canis lupus dingo TaxID=286419 RepID=UPI0020C3BA82|nr:collagen alpha-1(III) chain-like [Canis lupus dingo]
MAAGTAPAARCRGNGSEALPGEQPGGRRLAPEGTAPRSSGAAAAGQRGPAIASAPLAAGGPPCSGAAPSPPTRRARAGQSGRSQEAELPGRSVRRGSGLPGVPLGRAWRAGGGTLSRRLSPLASGPTPAVVGSDSSRVGTLPRDAGCLPVVPRGVVSAASRVVTPWACPPTPRSPRGWGGTCAQSGPGPPGPRGFPECGACWGPGAPGRRGGWGS